MIELVINELLNTFPFFILGYLPVWENMRFSFQKSLIVMCLCEFLYLSLFALLVLSGFSSVSVQYLAAPIFTALMMFLIDADIGIIAFHFLFLLDYLMVIRAAAFYICQKLLHFSFFSWQAGVVTLLLTLATIFIMAKFLRGILADLSSVQVPEFWKTAWLLPFSATVIVLLLTGNIRNGSFKSNALLARIVLLICMFLISHLMLLFIRKLQEQVMESERNKTMEKLLKMQREQYEQLQASIQENRRARHDFRQHRMVIQDMVNRGDLDSLKKYLEEYEQQFPEVRETLYCGNLAVNAVFSYYADRARRAGIPITFKIDLPEKFILSETDFCVLIGNLLENALEACKTQSAILTQSKSTDRQTETDPQTASPMQTDGNSRFIRVLIRQNQMSAISIAIDNSCPSRPVWDGKKLLSTKHPGSGIGTESARYIARRYNGDARFEWKDGVFYASVMLNPQ